ncbi:PH domain-containing protein [Bowmanella pacifica]|uniref:YdbS-like PH domain-containing protein n=1 Tax=Bowmanella pacifica TaxID=502051 RepID=A0A917YV74_9ALTE|nr:PH domain-containing protein [Bowmanella pacifica]GGO67154.1 hypothetical protein GCM10010982_12940 [Bowmanella pacifica]
MEAVNTSKLIRSLEAVLEIFSKLFGTYLVYLLISEIGNYISEDFAKDTLLSLLLLPAIYVLKDSLIIFEPFFSKVEISKEVVTVKNGITPRITDSLKISSIDNVEVVKTPLGYIFNYASIRLYGKGGYVNMPYVCKADEVSKHFKLGTE